MTKQKEEKIMNRIELGLPSFSLTNKVPALLRNFNLLPSQLQAYFLSGVKDASSFKSIAIEKHLVYWVQAGAV